MRSILRNTGVQVMPGVTHAAMVKKIPLLKQPEEQMWKIHLLHSLLAFKAEEFEICFDDDDEEVEEYDVANEILRTSAVVKPFLFPSSIIFTPVSAEEKKTFIYIAMGCKPLSKIVINVLKLECFNKYFIYRRGLI